MVRQTRQLNLRMLRAVYKLLLSGGSANAESIREKIAPVPANLQSGAITSVELLSLGRTATDWIRAILPPDYVVERVTSFECCVIKGHLKETN